MPGAGRNSASPIEERRRLRHGRRSELGAPGALPEECQRAWLRTRQASLLLALALLSTGCMSLPPPPGQGMSLRYTPREPVPRVSAAGPSVEAPDTHAFPLGPETPQRLHRRRASPEDVTVVGPDSAERDSRQRALAAQLAFRGALLDVSGSTRRISGELSRLKTRGRGIAGGNGVFVRYVDDGAKQLRWIDAQLAAATRLANVVSEVEDPDMQLALLRLAGPRLEAALLGSLLLAIWLDFIDLADAVLTQHLYSVERMFADMWRWQERLEPAMTALSSMEPGQVEAAARDVPALVGHLTGELAATLETVREGEENVAKVLVLKEAIEALTLLSALKFSLPSVPPSAPALLGIGLSVGGDGVMMGTRIEEFREWFEKRGFTGEMDIDQFCVELEQAHHEAIHGGGNWKLGRTWPGEWNRMIMETLREAETRTSRMLTRNEILKIVTQRMKVYGIPMNFTSWRGP
jgi:hypothetical protein